MMKKIIFILTLVLIAVSNPMFAQIGINTDTPDPSAILDMRSPAASNKGLLIPRMTTQEKIDIIHPASGLMVYDTDKNCISQNIGSENSPEWTCLTLLNHSFFYMPSINISTARLGTFDLDLYQEYQTQFGNPQLPGSVSGAPASIPNFPNRTDLYYYVTYHTPGIVTINSISATGVMNYEVNSKADYDAYMNIVFVVK